MRNIDCSTLVKNGRPPVTQTKKQTTNNKNSKINNSFCACSKTAYKIYHLFSEPGQRLGREVFT